jgi:hypothetical protein
MLMNGPKPGPTGYSAARISLSRTYVRAIVQVIPVCAIVAAHPTLSRISRTSPWIRQAFEPCLSSSGAASKTVLRTPALDSTATCTNAPTG